MSKKPQQQPKATAKQEESPLDRYGRISERIRDAVHELNEALKEAHKESSMTVGLGFAERPDGHHSEWPWKPLLPTTIVYWTGRIQHHSLALMLSPTYTSEWKVVPVPADHRDTEDR